MRARRGGLLLAILVWSRSHASRKEALQGVELRRSLGSGEVSRRRAPQGAEASRLAIGFAKRWGRPKGSRAGPDERRSALRDFTTQPHGSSYNRSSPAG